MTNKMFLTIRETAKTGILPEYALRLRQAQHKLPCVYSGRKCLINYTQLVDMLNSESKKAVIE